MRLLHTSDWHLGRMLNGKKERSGELDAFMGWLLQVIKEQSVDLLLIAGDVFDSSAPSITSQKKYYDFLLSVRHSGCRNVVVVGGNHDSPGFLNAPKEILSAIQVRVIGNATENIGDEVITINDGNGNPVAIVCAVPFLRERDISRNVESESYADRSKRITESIKNHYALVAELAVKERQKLGAAIPVIGMGHLSVAGGKTVKDDGVRETFIGAIECVGSDIFPQTFDYVALGHYHIPSVIRDNLRYSGSPIPMGFGEANQKKSVYIVDFNENKLFISTLEIPVFQRLESIRGDKTRIAGRLTELKNNAVPVWVEVIYDGNEVFSDFSTWVNEQTADSKIEIINYYNRPLLNEVLSHDDNVQSLDELDTNEVFDRLLQRNGIPEEQKAELKQYYNEIVLEIEENQ